MNKTETAIVAAHKAGYRVNKEGNILNPDGTHLKGKTFKFNDYAIEIKRFIAYCTFGDDCFGKMIRVRPGAKVRPDTISIAVSTKSMRDKMPNSNVPFKGYVNKLDAIDAQTKRSMKKALNEGFNVIEVAQMFKVDSNMAFVINRMKSVS